MQALLSAVQAQSPELPKLEGSPSVVAHTFRATNDMLDSVEELRTLVDYSMQAIEQDLVMYVDFVYC